MDVTPEIAFRGFEPGPEIQELVVSRDPSRDERRRSARVGITDAFGAMRRQLEEHSQEARGDVKAHEAPPHGRIVKLKPLQGYGFLESADLEVGEEVRFSEAEEGIEGPQASAVWPAGKHHAAERRPRKKAWK